MKNTIICARDTEQRPVYIGCCSVSGPAWALLHSLLLLQHVQNKAQHFNITDREQIKKNNWC